MKPRLRPLVLAAIGILLLAACAPRLQPPGDMAVRPELMVEDWRASDGRMLPLRRWLPDGAPDAVILALHGFNDYGNAFADLGAWLAERGIAIYAPDQRGFGASPHRGLWPGGDRLAEDLIELSRLLQRRHPNTPLYWLGDSMGGAVALLALKRDALRPSGVVLVAPAVWGRATMPVHYRTALWLASHTVPWMTVTGRGLDILASDNIEMLRRLSRDPMVIKETRIDAIYGLVDLMDEAAEARPRGLPILLLYGAKDEVIPRKPVEAFVAALMTAPEIELRVAIYDEGWHMLLRDLQAGIVWQDIEAWIANHRVALPSGEEIEQLPLFAGKEEE